MVVWRSAFLICLAFSLATLVQRGSGDSDLRLEDALKETSSVKPRWDHVTTTTKRPGTTRAPAKPAGSSFILADALDDPDDGRRKPSAGGGERWDRGTTTTKRPGTTRAPAKPADDDFNLADALDDRNDRDDGRRKPSAGGGGFSDKDLEDILGGGEYKPDKGDGRYGSDDSESGVSAEAGTIAGVASALAMALIGAVSSYISYQQKKFCFSIQHAAEGQEGLNADYVKGENLEAVVCEEPQVKYLTLQTQSAEPPPPEAPRI
ncbi:CD99 antigen-like protein 2 isoform X1 [Ursus americanus]|uniref:CD99 antigen-like protein 2 n=1 Tax=Ursus maritimus TaxID=29073 RepID=A0A8M1FPP0_URSMA|nr:CD99 antigen-like protein 2 isoform X2 [Ursus arctos]XP_040484042.1 CD99 antigen-like protein 2 isoform X1 [Ursus maritimus]XP_045661069.1 CD99 antigen-like protein 2 isoform X1 [Ursus americanus]